MKNSILLSAMILICFTAFGQEKETKGVLEISSDVVSRYVWRGTQYSDAPAIQPGVSYSKGGFSAGAWGSYAFDNIGTECDLYIGYDFDFGLGLIVNDYFFPSYDGSTLSEGGYLDDTYHTFEIGLTYDIKDFSMGAYRYMNQDEDIYVEASYTIKNTKLFIGAGDNAYSASGNFNVCSAGFTVSKEISLTENWKVSPYASFIVNPNKEQGFLVLGITL